MLEKPELPRQPSEQLCSVQMLSNAHAYPDSQVSYAQCPSILRAFFNNAVNDSTDVPSLSVLTARVIVGFEIAGNNSG